VGAPFSTFGAYGFVAWLFADALVVVGWLNTPYRTGGGTGALSR
jgi:hypothetical protein